MPLPSLLDTPSKRDFQPPAKRPDRTLLIVDDEEGPRQSLRVVFRDEYRLLTAASGEEALALTQTHRVDAAVVDLRMAGMSGLELMEQLKRLDPKLEVIILTAYETLETARRALRLGAADYLTKPFDLGTVRAAVANAMKRRDDAEVVAATNRRLKELQQELDSQKLRTEMTVNRGEIYGSVLHDINGPLTVIAGFISLLELQLSRLPSLDAQGTREFKERLGTVNRHVSNCVDITQRYLGFLRHTGEEPEGVSVNQVLKDIAALLHSHPSAQHHQVTIQSLETDGTARVNGTDFIQVLLNLTINALQATATPHRVELVADLVAGPLEATTFREGPCDRFLRHDRFEGQRSLVALTVRDDGPGMAPEVVEKLFRMQFTSKPAPVGTGLGLSIVKRLVLLSRGALTMHSEPGKGTCFTLYLPLK